MTQLATQHRNGQSPLPWLTALREAAGTHFAKRGFPTRQEEEWRFTNVDPIARTRFVPATPIDDSASSDVAARFSFGTDAVCEIVFINGHYAPSLSRLETLPDGVEVQTLVDGIHAHPGEIKADLGRLAEAHSNPFVALNQTMLRDGVYIRLPRGSVVERPIHLLFLTIPSAEPVATHPRVLLVAEENSHATIVESYGGEGSGLYFTNAVTEVFVAAGSRIDHCKLQQETMAAHHVSITQVNLARDSQFVSHSTTMGGKLTRNDVNVILGGEGADATVNGLVLLNADRHCDNHTLLDHAAANCASHELYKHVLDGRSTGVFKGKILVRPNSQKTNSKQTSKTLLLSDEATMHAMPALEIYADDVKCTHGSTTGPVDEEQVFYLRSRGIGLEAARHVLSYAFAADITRRIRVEPVRARIENFMAAQHGLPQDMRITGRGNHDEAVVNS